MNLSVFERKADELYSERLRRKAADYRGMVHCITCGKMMRWQDAQCSHYISRRHHATRFIEDNTHIMCAECNNLHNENKEPYLNWMLANTKAGTLSRLHSMSKDYVSDIDYKEMLNKVILDCKREIKILNYRSKN